MLQKPWFVTALLVGDGAVAESPRAIGPNER
jgi:hypothetical protein